MSLLLVESSSVGHTTIFVTARKAIPLSHRLDLTFLSGHTVMDTPPAGEVNVKICTKKKSVTIMLK